MKRLSIGLAALAALTAEVSFAHSTDAELHEACRAAGTRINDEGYVRIGSIQQWVAVEGQDCRNPVVLMVHGGPGNPNTPFAHQLYGAWAKDFTIVQWDQRGAGKTYAINRPAEDEALTMERLARDGVEVAAYAAKRFGKRKVILMGSSWGSALAVNMALTAPELFHAYVGTAQLANYNEDLKVGYSTTFALARAAGDVDAIETLEKLGAPPWTNPRSFGALRRITRKYEARSSDPAPEGWFTHASGYDTPAYREAYSAGEDYSFLHFVGLAGDGMGPKIDLFKDGRHFPIPVYLIQGEEDLVTPAKVSRAWFDAISAPRKELLVLPRTGHDPNQAMIDAQFKVLSRLRKDVPMRDRK